MSSYVAEIKAPVRWVIRNGEKILQQARQCYDNKKAWIEWTDVPIIDSETGRIYE